MRTRPKPISREAAWLDLDAFLPYQMLVATERMSHLFARRYAAEFGITIPESRVLTVIARYAPLSSREICDRTMIGKSQVSVAVSRLVAAGLLTREADPSDGRLLSLCLSLPGEALYRRLVPVALEMEAALLRTFSTPDRARLLDMLVALGQAAGGQTPNLA